MRHNGQDPYVSEAQTKAILRFGSQYRLQRMQAADMITTDEAAALSDTTRVTMNAWIKSGRCIGVSHLRRGYRLPRWQFEPFIFATPLCWPASTSTARRSMQRDPRAFLWDVREAALAIQTFTAGLDVASYENN
jgi:hypothetical protein